MKNNPRNCSSIFPYRDSNGNRTQCSNWKWVDRYVWWYRPPRAFHPGWVILQFKTKQISRNMRTFKTHGYILHTIGITCCLYSSALCLDKTVIERWAIEIERWRFSFVLSVLVLAVSMVSCDGLVGSWCNDAWNRDGAIGDDALLRELNGSYSHTLSIGPVHIVLKSRAHEIKINVAIMQQSRFFAATMASSSIRFVLYVHVDLLDFKLSSIVTLQYIINPMISAALTHFSLTKT